MEMFASHGWLQGLVCAGVLIHHGGSQILSHLVVEDPTGIFLIILVVEHIMNQQQQ